MFGTSCRNHLIDRPAHGDALQNLLELAFGINVDRRFAHILKGGPSFAQNEIPRRLEIAVEINCANDRFEGVSQSGSARAAAAGLLAAAH